MLRPDLLFIACIDVHSALTLFRVSDIEQNPTKEEMRGTGDGGVRLMHEVVGLGTFEVMDTSLSLIPEFAVVLESGE